jgi:hypothetical protein
MFNPYLPGVSEARLAVLQAVMQANLPSLVAALRRDGLLPSSINITPDMVILGNVQTLPPVEKAPILFCVDAGGDSNGEDITSSQQYLEIGPSSGYCNELKTSIYVFLHPDLLPPDPTLAESVLVRQQASTRRLVVARCTDWLRAACFNTQASIILSLESQEYSTTPYNDLAYFCHLSSIKTGLFLKNFGGAVAVYGAEAVHSMMVQRG